MTRAGSRILITGTFCSLNKGDAAMRIAMTDELKKAIPGCHVTMMTPFPELDKSAYRSDLTLRCSRRRPLKVMSMVVRALCWRGIHRLLRIDPSWVLNDELRVYRNSDVVIDLSGDGLTEEYGIKCILAHLVPILLGKLLCRPVFVCAQTIGPLRKTLPVCRWILKRADSVTARERLTFDYLSKLGLNGSRLSLTADMAFLVEPAPPEAARELLAKERVSFHRPLIGFSISRLPGHVLGSLEDQKPTNLELEMAKILDRVAAMGLQPVFISHATGPGERRDDRKAAARVAQLAQPDSGVVVLAGDYSAEETKGIIGQMDMFVGVRMHSCIAGMSMGVPTISIAYGPKAFGIMSLAGQDSWLMDIREVTADKLFPLIEEMWQGRQTVRESLQKEISTVRAMAAQNVRIVQSLLSSRNSG